MNSRIAFFDFDGTVTTRDTLLEFIRFTKGSLAFYTGFLLNSPWLVAYRLKIISNQSAKQRILSWFFRNIPLAEFNALCDRFSTEALPGLIRPKALKEMDLLREKGFAIVIVTAVAGVPENHRDRDGREGDIEDGCSTVDDAAPQAPCGERPRLPRIAHRYSPIS